MTAEEKREVEEKEHCILFSIRRYIRYYNYRKRFFDNLHNFSTLLTAVSAKIDLIIGSPRAVRLYEDLSRRFTALEKEIVLSKDSNMRLLNEIEAKRLDIDIEVDEPPHLKVLNAVCNNEMLRAMGYDRNEFQKIDPVQELLRQFWDFRAQSL